jgi:AcrR family transcriptional regulator
MPDKASEAAAALPQVRDGVFFTLPPVLPRGRHRLPPEQVAGAQRERLLAAVTELLAARGYRDFGASDIARRAGVSLEAFYACFGNKDDCIFAGYERFIQVLLQRMMALQVSGAGRAQIIRNIVGTYLETLQGDLVVARAYQLEIDALGAPARERRRRSLTRFAVFLREAVAQTSTRRKPPPELTWSAYLGVVYAIRQLVSDALEAEDRPDLAALGADAEAWLVDLFRQR